MIVFILLVLIGGTAFFVSRYICSKNWLINKFKKGNVIVFGNKGKGKDLVFQKVIKWRQKEKYFSNLNYGFKFNPISLKELDMKNDYNNFINEKLIFEEKKQFEGSDIYISDCGIYLPSQHDTLLHKTYKGLPIMYALSRQLYNNNIHTNVQNLEREWKALREIGDTYIWAYKTIKIFGFLITKIYVYERYQTAVNRTLPLKISIFDKDNNLQRKQFYATNGEIESMYIINRIKTNKYDTRAFHQKVFGYIFSETIK